MERSAIALTGFMGAGKSTVGRVLADRLGWRFVDLDAEIVEHHGPIRAFFDRHGESAFREAEARLLREVRPSQVVLALGGGALLDPHSRAWVESRFHTVFLDVPLDVAARRVGTGADRPLWKDAEERYAARRAIYASARLRVDATRSPEEISEELVPAGPRVERVALGGRSYDVVITDSFEGLADRVASDVRLVTDDTVGPLWLDSVREHIDGPVLTVPAGERHKTLDTWRDLVDGLIASRTLRSTAVVALGGGVVGDLAGFAAASVNRGVPFVQLPTTTLAMVDSSVGGKTGVNHARGKNLVGAFHQPDLVWMNLSTLSTLDDRQRRAGLAEVLKTAVMLDPVLFEILEACAPELAHGEPGLTEHVVALSVRAKARIVAQDERESGVRRVLNAGHTIGHAIERAAAYGSILHGEAVSIGLVVEAQWAARAGHCDGALPARIERVANALGLPVKLPAGLGRDALLDAMSVDKKAAHDILYLPVPARVGASLVVPYPIPHLESLLPELR